MRKGNKICVVVATILAILLGMSNFVQAKVKIEELDPKGWITLPSFVRDATLRISVNPNAGSSYSLYYQMKLMTDSQFNTMETKQREFETELEKKEQIVETKTAEYTAIAERYNEEANNGTVTEETRQALEAAKAAQKAAISDYMNYGKAAEEELLEIIPEFVETEWKQITDGTAKLDYEGKTGSVHFVLWAKLVANGETIYDMNVYTTSVSSKETVSIGESTLSLRVGESKTLTLSHSNGTQNVIWESSDETIAEVDETGKVTAMREGRAVITVQLADGSSRDTCTVTVTSESGGSGSSNGNGSGSDSENPPKGNITIPGTNQNQVTGGSGTSTNTSGNKPTGVTGNMDNTKAGGKIPQTGTNYTVILVVAVFAITGGFCYYQYRKYNF